MIRALQILYFSPHDRLHMSSLVSKGLLGPLKYYEQFRKKFSWLRRSGRWCLVA